ncbi:hypothetical protein F4821DRAFT_276968 [Hypoxylon rubiginosum]|uniref:Uncharacterized protein n=1 Tax=Hypoxylon rubiginosum TaxID=110542 RepID=A0ACC0D7Z7_9PEZI|nr:hypothetical protein F4821DRAFT_276968 [Hypoxylon rubiginosum]
MEDQACPTDPNTPCDADTAQCPSKKTDVPNMVLLREFLDPYFQGENSDGRTLDYILSQSDEWLANTDNWIQWPFPLRAGTRYNKNAPRIDTDTREYIIQHRRFKEQVRLAVARVLWMYGFRVSYSPRDITEFFEIALEPAANGDEGNPHHLWTTEHSPHHARIGRMIRCLSRFEMDEEASNIARAFEKINDMWGGVVNEKALNSWTKYKEVQKAVDEAA